jgi:lipopolysaccharide export system protein LptC
MAVAYATDDEDSIWTPRRQVSLERARRRSRLVLHLRRLFVALAGAAAASVFAFMAVFTAQGGFSGGANLNGAEPLTMLNPRFTGREESGGAYRLTAEMAIREAVGDRLLRLSGPLYQTQEGASLIAPKGEYDEAAAAVRLTEGVTLVDRQGNRFITPSVVVNLRTGIVEGIDGVTGTGPLGAVRAGSYELRRSDGALVLRGGVTGMLPERSAAPAQN